MEKCFASVLVLFLFISPALADEFIFKDPQYSFQTLRAIGATSGGAADIGECLKTAHRITEGDSESWYEEWNKTAAELEKAGDAFLGKGRKLSASETFMRASNYYRTAEFFLHGNPDDPRILQTWGKGRDLFRKAVGLIETPIVSVVRIPFEETTLPGYYCRVDGSGRRRPLLIIQTGFDGTGEEIYYEQAIRAVRRGYNCLIFEGPGQGEMIRVQHVPFRPNWETVVTPVVDFALKQPETDPGRIALMGISFGGYLAPRAVAFEHRIKACIANGGVYDFHANFVKGAPADFEKMLDDPEEAKGIDKDVYETMKKDPGLRWVFNNGMYTFGAKSPSELIRMTRPYTMKDVADKITCKMLVVDSEKDADMPGQAKRLFDALHCPKTWMLFTVEEGAEQHCQIGAFMISNERILDWLDDNL